jgi:hypothetical protein
MTARLSLLDQTEDPWAQHNGQSGRQMPLQTSVQHQAASGDNAAATWAAPTFDGTAALRTSWLDGATQSALERTSNRYNHDNGAQSLDTGANALAPGDLANGSSGTASNLTPASSQDLLELDDIPLPSHRGRTVEQSAPVVEKQPTQNEHEQASVPTESQALPQGDNLRSDATQVSVPSRPAPTSTPLSEEELRKQLEKQAETYAIRHINWTDYTGQLRESPILVQNKNGPCPLLALVNGLIMRSEKNAQPPIVKALQTREQISLGLLIQALFDELTTYHEELPDIEALSRFLTMLHTGMNVNPRLTLVCIVLYLSKSSY